MVNLREIVASESLWGGSKRSIYAKKGHFGERLGVQNGHFGRAFGEEGMRAKKRRGRRHLVVFGRGMKKEDRVHWKTLLEGCVVVF